MAKPELILSTFAIEINLSGLTDITPAGEEGVQALTNATGSDLECVMYTWPPDYFGAPPDEEEDREDEQEEKVQPAFKYDPLQVPPVYCVPLAYSFSAIPFARQAPAASPTRAYYPWGKESGGGGGQAIASCVGHPTPTGGGVTSSP